MKIRIGMLGDCHAKPEYDQQIFEVEAIDGERVTLRSVAGGKPFEIAVSRFHPLCEVKSA